MTAKQRANIEKHRQLPVLSPRSLPNGLPRGSWWLDRPREGFSDVAAVEAQRMQWSKFAHTLRGAE